MHRRSARGFTVIELLLVIVVVCILGLFVALAYSGVQADNRNADRQNDIELLKSQLEAHYAEANTYPTLANLNDPAWRTANLKRVSADTIRDPRWDEQNTACTTAEKPMFSALPAANCYSYQVTGTDGSPCDNTTIACAHYTLTATLEGGEKYVKSSLN
jgi:prepilin-type N-terminal cleavage/methylation domain-containing protein